MKGKPVITTTGHWLQSRTEDTSSETRGSSWGGRETGARGETTAEAEGAGRNEMEGSFGSSSPPPQWSAPWAHLSYMIWLEEPWHHLFRAYPVYGEIDLAPRVCFQFKRTRLQWIDPPSCSTKVVLFWGWPRGWPIEINNQKLNFSSKLPPRFSRSHFRFWFPFPSPFPSTSYPGSFPIPLLDLERIRHPHLQPTARGQNATILYSIFKRKIIFNTVILNT